jgi:hypothetical protein
MLQIFKRLFSKPRVADEAVRSVPPAVLNAIDQVTRFIQQFPTDQLCQVLAFCEDGKMDYHDSCECLRGVFGALHIGMPLHKAAALRQGRGFAQHVSHYSIFSDSIALQAEKGYFALGFREGFPFPGPGFESQTLRDHYLQEILRLELRGRDSKHEQVQGNPPFARILGHGGSDVMPGTTTAGLQSDRGTLAIRCRALGNRMITG